MKLKFYILAAYLILTLFYSFVNVESTDNQKSESVTYLTQYGEYVFKREGCLNCHRLNESGNPQLVSLDGMQGKYPATWHYIHLTDPPATSPGSKMPSYQNLSERYLVRSVFETISDKNSFADWRQLLNQADSMESKLKEDALSANGRTEMLALIAYLNSIPRSAALQRKDSLNSSHVSAEDIKWDSLLLNPNSALYKMAADKKNIEAGKIIFAKNCVPCHGANATGGIGPNLTDTNWLHGGGAQGMAKTIIYGVPERGMMAWRYMLQPDDIGKVVAYLNMLSGASSEKGKRN